MDKERIKGAAQEVAGSIKKAVGRLLGNKALENKGKVEGATGAIRTAVGEGKDTVKDVLRDRDR